jgi:hypothetical protein
MKEEVWQKKEPKEQMRCVVLCGAVCCCVLLCVAVCCCVLLCAVAIRNKIAWFVDSVRESRVHTKACLMPYRTQLSFVRGPHYTYIA